MSNAHVLINQKEQRRFILKIDGHIAKVEYIENPEKIFLTHTEVPQELSGQGIGSTLVKLVLQHVEKTGKALMPLCPFVAAYIKKYPEWKRLLADGVNIG